MYAKKTNDILNLIEHCKSSIKPSQSRSKCCALLMMSPSNRCGQNRTMQPNYTKKLYPLINWMWIFVQHEHIFTLPIVLWLLGFWALNYWPSSCLLTVCHQRHSKNTMLLYLIEWFKSLVECESILLNHCNYLPILNKDALCINLH